MDDAQVASWEFIFPPQPVSPSTASTLSSYVPSESSSSPLGTTTSLASSPGPPTPYKNASSTTSNQMTLSIDYGAVLDQLQILYPAFKDAQGAIQVFQDIIQLVIDGREPTDALVNSLILRDGGEYRCPVNACKRSPSGQGWSRLDRARGHFRTEHLAILFSCNVPGW